MQLMVAEDDDVEALLGGLREIEEACQETLARVIAQAAELPRSPHARISAFGAPLVRDGLTSHLQATIEWAQRSRRALLNRRDGGATGVPGRHRP